MAEQRRSPNAAELFERGDQFWQVIEVLGPFQKDDLFAPKVICIAFAAEAYLKSLLALRGKRYPHDHDLHRLFSLLPTEDKRFIEEIWNAENLADIAQAKARPESWVTGLIPSTLNQALKDSANAFKEWRYRTDGTTMFWLNAFPMNVKVAILRIRPDWVKDPPDYFGRQSKDRAR